MLHHIAHAHARRHAARIHGQLSCVLRGLTRAAGGVAMRCSVGSAAAALLPLLLLPGLAALSATEQLVLADVFSSTVGSGWSNNTGWTGATVSCSAYGVLCSPGGALTGLQLASNGLTGSFPQSLCNAPALVRSYRSPRVPPLHTDFTPARAFSPSRRRWTCGMASYRGRCRRLQARAPQPCAARLWLTPLTIFTPRHRQAARR